MRALRRAVAALSVLAVLAAVSLAAPGCSASPGARPEGAVVKPGTTNLPDGTIRVVGTLELRDLEGGIWVVVDSAPGPGAAKAKVLAVIVNPELFDMDKLKGRYVSAQGTVSTGPSANMAGPQMTAKALAPVARQP